MKETKKCPFCGGEILAVAKKCKHCKQFIEKKENKADEITKDIDTSSNTPAIKDKKNQMIVAITIVAFIFIIIVVCVSGTLYLLVVNPITQMLTIIWYGNVKTISIMTKYIFIILNVENLIMWYINIFQNLTDIMVLID